MCKFGLALAHHIILTKNYPTNERSFKAKFTVCALSFVHFSLLFRLGTKTTKCCRHFVVLLMCTADQQNTVSRPKKRISAVPTSLVDGDESDIIYSFSTSVFKNLLFLSHWNPKESLIIR